MDKVWVGQKYWRYGCGSLYLFIPLSMKICESACSAAQSWIFISGPQNFNVTSLFCQITIDIIHLEGRKDRLGLKMVAKYMDFYLSPKEFEKMMSMKKAS